MRTVLNAVVALTLTQLACSHTTARVVSAPAVMDADSVIANYCRAIGGYARLKSVTSRRMRGSYSEGTLEAATDIVWRRPSLRRVNVDAPGFKYSEGFDAFTWELNLGTGKFVRDTGAAADAGRRGAEFDESFVDYRAKGHSVTLVGREHVLGRDTYRLRVRLSDGWEKEYFIDQSTFLIVAMRKAMPVHAAGPAVESLSSYEDWRDVDGLLVPHRFTERVTKTGALMNTLRWDRIEHNTPIADQEIRAPRRPI